MGNKAESDRLQVLYDLEMTNLTDLATQISTLVSSGVNYTIGDQHFDFTSQLMALNNMKNASIANLKAIIELQNIKNPYYLVSRGR